MSLVVRVRYKQLDSIFDATHHQKYTDQILADRNTRVEFHHFCPTEDCVAVNRSKQYHLHANVLQQR